GSVGWGRRYVLCGVSGFATVLTPHRSRGHGRRYVRSGTLGSPRSSPLTVLGAGDGAMCGQEPWVAHVSPRLSSRSTARDLRSPRRTCPFSLPVSSNLIISPTREEELGYETAPRRAGQSRSSDRLR